MKRYFLFLLAMLSSIFMFGQVYILNEDFVSSKGSTSPIGWINYSLIEKSSDLWHFDNSGKREVNYPMTAPFAIFDAETISDNGTPERVALESPFFDASIGKYTLLKFNQTFSPVSGANAIIEAFDGKTWKEVTRFTSGTANTSSYIVDVSAVVGGITNAKIRFVWEGQSKGYWAVDNISILAPLRVDGGLVNLDNPIPPFKQGQQPVKVSLGNFGYQDLTSATIKWIINGIQQPDYKWTGLLKFGSIQENIQLGTYNFKTSSANIKIWQSFPNNLEDLNPSNDSIVKKMRPALCGEYTIGGVTPDFATIEDAVSVLNTSGISCAVVFKVRDGLYNENNLITSIPGSSAQNTVTFKSESGNNSMANINMGQISLKGAGNLIFSRIGLDQLSIDDNSSFIVAEHSILVDLEVNGNSHHLTISENQLKTLQLKEARNVDILNNFGQGDMTLSTARDVMVVGNRLNSITLNYLKASVIKENRISTLNKEIGIEINSSDTVLVCNNYIYSVGSNQPTTGISLNSSSHTKIYFNSINITNTDIGQKSIGLMITSGNQNDIKNNIFSIKNAGYPVQISNGTADFTFDYNDYFDPHGMIGRFRDMNYRDLASWKQAIGQDAHSLNVNPFYVEGAELLMNQVLLNNSAIPIPEILLDIDGTKRKAQPDFGAKEYDPCLVDAGISAISVPEIAKQGEQNVKVILQNQGTSTLNTVTINWQVNGLFQKPYEWTGALPVSENTEVIIGRYSFTKGLYLIKATTSKPNGKDDCHKENDLLEIGVANPLCGEYTIGGVAPDFINVTDAVTFLNTAGISCAVLFKVRDGQYNENNLITSITGSSAQNTVTFKSESGDSTKVNIGQIKLNEASYLKFSKIGLKQLSIGSNSSFVTVEHSILGDLVGSDYSHHLTISANELGTLYFKDVRNVDILNNIEQGDMTLYSVRNAMVKSNRLHGINSYYLKGSVIRDNRISILDKASGIGINSGDSILVCNNYISTAGSNQPAIGIGLNSSSHTKIYFNSLNITNTDIDQKSVGLMMNSGSQNDIKNNIFNIKNAGCPVQISNGTANLSIDYNDYFHPDGLIGRYVDTNYKDLESWRQITNQDAHSLSVNPFYTAVTELQINQGLLNNSALPIPEILLDIDGTKRNTQPDYGAKEYNPCSTDASINLISSPRDIVKQGEQSVKIILQNQGTSTLNSVNINWKIGNVLQKPYTWTGVLAMNKNIEVPIGNYSFVSGLYSIKVWTSNPNGKDDCNNQNDTIRTRVATPLCGEYSIGGVTPDFVTIKEAVSVLNTAGISCAVVFKIRDGNYNEKNLIDSIPGSSAQNTVTFTSENGDSTKVNIGQVSLSEVGYLEFRKIGLNQLLIDGNSSYIVVEHSKLGAVSGSGNSHHLTISANELGTLQFRDVRNVDILNNLGQGEVTLYNTKDAMISGNKLSYGLNLRYLQNSSIKNNRINILEKAVGIGLYYSGMVLVYNNYVHSAGGHQPTKGIELDSSTNIKIYFNSIDITNTDIAEKSIGLMVNIGSQNDIRNNIFNIKSVGCPVQITNGTSGFSFDYNDYFQPDGLIGQYWGTNYSILKRWGNDIHGDANSKNIEPYFAAEDNPLPYQRDLNGAAIPIADITLDINGNLRNDLAPDIGAVEFMIDFGTTQLIGPNEDCNHSSIEKVTVSLRQFGDLPFKDLSLSYQMNGGKIYTDTILGTNYNNIQYTFKTSVDLSAGGDYKFRLWLNGIHDDNANNDTLATTLHTKPAPVVDFNYNNECTGYEMRFTGTASVSNPYVIERYVWDFGDGDAAFLQNPVHIFKNKGTYQVRLKAYSSAGCYSEIIKAIQLNESDKMQFNLQKKNIKCGNSCVGEVTINLTGGKAPVQAYFNNELFTQTTKNNLCSGTYTLRATDSKGCEITEKVDIIKENPMTLSILADTTRGNMPFDINLSAIVTGAKTYQWLYHQDIIGTSLNIPFTMTEPGQQYIAFIANSGPPNNCVLSDSISIQVEIIVEIKIPNAFTPNNDGYNDTFGLATKNVNSLKMEIKDRNGRLVHTINEVGGRWDGSMPSGSEAPPGIYYYYLTANGNDGQTYTRQGSVSLFRDLIELTPNPVQSNATLDVTGKLFGEKEITIYNASGIAVRTWQTKEDKIVMELISLPSGFYTIKVSGEGQAIAVKFIKS
jgi:gliding motility-associated-like protein